MCNRFVRARRNVRNVKTGGRVQRARSNEIGTEGFQVIRGAAKAAEQQVLIDIDAYNTAMVDPLSLI